MKAVYRVFYAEEFRSWLGDQPPKARAIVIARLDLLTLGHLGNHKRFDGLIELRWLNGTRVYAFFWKNEIIIAAHGGNKNGQSKDIKKSQKIRREVIEGIRSILKP